ncbi:MAG: hypothetical protein HIU82_04300 [Proteobacteria bacterium]|nr:hypothetical protein [Pseudomonadota bacterium]
MAQPRGGQPPGQSTPSILSSGGRIGGQQGGHRRVVVAPCLVAPSLTAQGGLLAYFGEALGQPGEQRDKTIEEGGGDHGVRTYIEHMPG